MKPSTQRIEHVRSLGALLFIPMTPDEKRAFNAARAAEVAKAEAQRQPTPQLPLPGAI